ncbi:hypothetical protein [Pedococcus aerophilus]
MNRTGKVSAAQAKRRRQELLEQKAGAPTPLPADFVHYVENVYKPRGPVVPRWEQVRPLVLLSLLGSNVTGTKSLKQHVTHVGHFWVWALKHGHPADCRTTLTRSNVDEYTRVGMPNCKEKSRSDRRSRLRGLADHHNPADVPFKGVSISRAGIRPPYTQDEIDKICRVAKVQPTAEMRRKMCLCVAMGAGAGIDSPELKLLQRDHVLDEGECGIALCVPGPRARKVTVLREYEDLLREGLKGLTGSALLLGRLSNRHNVASDVFARATLLGSVPHLEQSRLRSTWMATLMTRPVPLAVLMDAAGVRTAGTLVELVPYLDAAQNLVDGSTR